MKLPLSYKQEVQLTTGYYILQIYLCDTNERTVTTITILKEDNPGLVLFGPVIFRCDDQNVPIILWFYMTRSLKQSSTSQINKLAITQS